eukprot:TRINITY_DN19035_c0_g1_i2.p2 TRINITY_DN19035_c0_g1~~TRINITY_DN19035_c0_g1_i2.p2  ORF type:complete len:110 (-),score=33.08 TRINITY_DN19035_c0_g1_i2:46-375(-)
MCIRDSTGREWAIEFNITMAHIPCKYASVDIADRHGMVQHNVTTNIERWHVDEKFEPYLEHVAHDALEYEEVDPVSYTHLRAHETPEHLVCRLLLEKKKKTSNTAICNY